MEGDNCRYGGNRFFAKISIHSLRMEGDDVLHDDTLSGSISIHSLRMEGDLQQTAPKLVIHHFNPLPPHGGRLFGSFC